MSAWKFLFIAVFMVGCNSDPNDTDEDIETQDPDNSCGHRIDAAIVEFGFNIVLNTSGTTQVAQGKPLQESWTLAKSPSEIDNHNDREYAQIAAAMMPIRDALMCDIAMLEKTDWLFLTQTLTLNNIRMEQDLSGTPPEQVYSTEGIYDLLKASENFHAMMKYVEEAELELKCIAFEDFDFTNPEGDDHCAIHDLPVGQGLVLP
jgi:hypothetical protein